MQGTSLEELKWRKSSRSGGGQTCACVEMAGCDLDSPHTHVRDSKDPEGPQLIFPAAVWAAFSRGAKAGRYDL